MSDQEDLEVMRALATEYLKNRVERETFEMRLGVTHPDYEVFLNGEVTSIPQISVDAAKKSKMLGELVESKIKYLRKKIWTEKPKYSLLELNKEIGYVLGNILIDMDNHQATVDAMSKLSEVFHPEIDYPFEAAHYHYMNKLMRDSIVWPKSTEDNIQVVVTEKEDKPYVDGLSISKLDLSDRIQFVLRENGIQTIEDISKCSEQKLLGMSGFGLTSLNRVRRSLEPYGVKI